MMQSFKWYLLSVAEFNGCKMIIMSHKAEAEVTACKSICTSLQRRAITWTNTVTITPTVIGHLQEKWFKMSLDFREHDLKPIFIFQEHWLVKRKNWLIN